MNDFDKIIWKDFIRTVATMIITGFSAIGMWAATATWFPVFRVLFEILWIPIVTVGLMDLQLALKKFSDRIEACVDQYLDSDYEVVDK